MPDQDLVAAVVKALQDAAPTVERPGNHDQSLFDLGLDSLDHSAMLLALEEAYRIDIPDEDVDGLKSVNQIVAYLEQRIGR